MKQEAKEFKIFLKEGYAGLQKFLLQKSGIDPKLAEQMTPDKLEEYKSAKEKAQQSFLPNWKDPYEAAPVEVKLPKMSEGLQNATDAANKASKSLYDLAQSAEIAVKDGDDYQMPEYKMADYGGEVAAYEMPDGSIAIENFYDDVQKAMPIISELGTGLESLSEQTQQTAEQMNTMQDAIPEYSEPAQPAFDETPVINVIDSFGDLNTVVEGVSENLSSLTAPEYATQESPFSAIEPEMQSLVQTFQILGAGVGEVTVRISELSAALESLSLQKANSSPASTASQPVEVTNNISIEEAHAWDYDHIQELAEKVADIIEPRIISEIGGSSNAY